MAITLSQYKSFKWQSTDIKKLIHCGNTIWQKTLYQSYVSEQLPDIPEAKQTCIGCTHNDKLYIFGGGTTNYYIYDEATGYEEHTDAPYPIAYSTAFVHNNEIHLVGDGIKHYRLHNGVWEKVSELPLQYVSDWHRTPVISYKNELYILGTSSPYVIKDMKFGIFKYNESNSTWEIYRLIDEKFINLEQTKLIECFGSLLVVNCTGQSLRIFDTMTDIEYEFDMSQYTSDLPPSFDSEPIFTFNNSLYIAMTTTLATDTSLLFKIDYNYNVTLETQIPSHTAFALGIEYNSKVHLLGGKNSSLSHQTVSVTIN